MYLNIPSWLRQPKSRVYCTHRDKVPTVKVNDLSTFYSFDEAITLIQEDPTLGLGVGIWGYLCGIDLDHCIEDNIINGQAQAIINLFPEAYIEKSLSGTGIHILFLCKEQYHDKNQFYIKMGKKQMKEKYLTFGGLEIYQGLYDHRYLTLTGDVIQSPTEKQFVTGVQLLTFLQAFCKKPVQQTTATPEFTSDDDEDKAWLRWALRQHKPKKLIDCWFKYPTGSGGTESEDDLIFMSELAFYSNNNPLLMRVTFEASHYYKNKDTKHKNKWARQDYSEGVISKAMQPNVAKVFFQESYQYNPETKQVEAIHIERSDVMIAPKLTTRVSQRGETLAVIDTKTYKFESSMPRPKKNSSEQTVQWVSVYKKGSDEPSRFLDRTDPAFELAAGIVLDNFKEEV